MMPTAAEHRENARRAEARKAESIERSGVSDGFLTQWACGLTAQLERTRADIAENDGTAVFWGLYEGDNRVSAKLISFKCKFSGQTKYNWLLDLWEEKKYGRRFIPEGKNSRIQKQLGLCERRERAPAYAFMNGSGTGLSGNAWVQVARKDVDAMGADSVLIEESDGGTE